MAQVAGQNAARERMRAICPPSSIQKPCAKMNQRPATTTTQQEPSMMRRPPMRSV